jgi:peroxiredoxin
MTAVKSMTSLIVFVLAGLAPGAVASSAEPPAASVAEIQLKYDHALIKELTEYIHKNPKADDRDQAYAALFNKAIERDWFAETEELAQHYLKADPEGPVKVLAQVILTMGRAQAGRFEEALVQYRILIQGLIPDDQEEFAVSFTDSLLIAAIAEGEFDVARQVLNALLARFKENPKVSQKARNDLKRLDTVGKPAPAFAAEDIKGRPIRLDSMRGKYVLVDFWATWCSPCVAELPRLQAAYRLYGGTGLEIVSVSLDENKTAVTDFVKVRNLPWPQLHNATSSADLVESFGVSAIPATYLIDPQGTIVRLDLRGKKLDQVLGQLIKRPVSQVSGRLPN